MTNTLRLVFLYISTVALVSSFRLLVKYHHDRRRNFIISSQLNGDSDFKSNVKLPIVQVYENQELVGEFFFGGDYESSISKLNAFLSPFKSAMYDESSSSKLEYISWPVDNVYSDVLLQKYVSSERYVAVKMYRSQCQICQKFDSTYQDLAKSPYFAHIRWLQGDLDSLQDTKKNLITRLSGKTSKNSDNNFDEDCLTCQNNGFVTCSGCGGVGHVMKGEVAVICSQCLGLLAQQHFI